MSIKSTTPTPRQRAVLETIRDHIAVNGYSPTYRELGKALGIVSPNAVKCHLLALRAKGLIDYVPGKCRTLRVIEEGSDP